MSFGKSEHLEIEAQNDQKAARDLCADTAGFDISQHGSYLCRQNDRNLYRCFAPRHTLGHNFLPTFFFFFLGGEVLSLVLQTVT